jgi:predicted SAM-dependent methyltransferase
VPTCVALTLVLHQSIKPFRPTLESLLTSLKKNARHRLRFLRALIARRRLRAEVASGRPLRIVVGGGETRVPGWIHTDVHYLNLLKREDWQKFFRQESLDAILAEHVWEHLTSEQGLTAARNCFEYLRPGGCLRLAVPDGLHPDPAYREWVRPGGSGLGADDHKILYTHATLSHLLAAAGFEVELLEYFDEGGAFHATDWNPADGMVHRTRRFDERNRDGQLRYTSLLVDARKPQRT